MTIGKGLNGVHKPSPPSKADELREWVIVNDGRQSFIGRPLPGDHGAFEVKLSPAYLYFCNIQDSPQGVAVSRAIFTIDLFIGVTEVHVRPVMRVELKDLHPAELEQLFSHVEKAEHFRGQAKRQLSPISLETTMPRPLRKE